MLRLHGGPVVGERPIAARLEKRSHSNDLFGDKRKNWRPVAPVNRAINTSVEESPRSEVGYCSTDSAGCFTIAMEVIHENL